MRKFDVTKSKADINFDNSETLFVFKTTNTNILIIT